MSEKPPSNDTTKESVDSIESPKGADDVGAEEQKNEPVDTVEESRDNAQESIEKNEDTLTEHSETPNIKEVINAASGSGTLSWSDSFRSRFPIIIYIMGLLFVLFITAMIYLFVNLGHSRLFSFAPTDPGMPIKNSAFNKSFFL